MAVPETLKPGLSAPCVGSCWHELSAAELGLPHPVKIDLVLADLRETFDVSRDDLDLRFRRVDFHAGRRGERNR